MYFKNEIINKLLDDKKIIQKEYQLLFEDKNNYSESQTKKFNELLQKLIIFQKDEFTLSLGYIKFPSFSYRYFRFNKNQTIDFSHSIFYGNSSFYGTVFKKPIYFNYTTFLKKADFNHTHFFKNVYFIKTKFLETTYFSYSVFHAEVNFNDTLFKSTSFFKKAKFLYKTKFWEVIFSKTAYFIETEFIHIADFNKTIFLDNVTFHKTLFYKKAFFRNVTSEKLIDFSKISFSKLDLEYIKVSNMNFTNMKGLYNTQKVTLTNLNFENKESVRLIKSYFEKENNIIEANKYFAIEQAIYLDTLFKQKSIISNKNSILFVLFLNKFVSNFGTDWVRPLFVMFSFGFLASFFYILCSNTPTLFIFDNPSISNDIFLWTAGGFAISILMYLTYYYKKWGLLTLSILGYIGLIVFSQDLRLITNDISKLINPLNIFKGKDYFEDIAPYGMMVKLIMATLMYQFVMAFRQNTRRK